MRWLIISIIIVTLLLSGGCKNNQTQIIEYTYVVLNKDIKSDKYVLEISSNDGHMYIEISKGNWNQLNIGDSVTLNSKDELMKINNKPVH